MCKILIIDDDPDLCTLVSILLKAEGYRPETAHNGRSGVAAAAQLEPDLVLLDVMMPGESGWDVYQQLRQLGNIPIIFLSARGGEDDVVRGLRLGADDYVSKPFRRHELMARIKVVLRRTQNGQAGYLKGDVIYQAGDLRINATHYEVHRGGESIHLTLTEFKLLLLLAEHQGRPVSHEAILGSVWGPKQKGNLNLLKVYIRQVRQKIEPNPDRLQYILTIRGVGYRLGM